MSIYTNVTDNIQESRNLAALLWSLLGLFFGLLLCINALRTLTSNEQQAVHHAKTLAEGQRVVRSIELDQAEADNDGKLVHLSGEVTVDEVLRDTLFDVEIVNVIKLRRRVEMYQWEEQQYMDEYGTLDARYRKKWSEHLINSKQFELPKGHRNPASMPVKTKAVIAKQVKLGDFTLSASLIEPMNDHQKLPMTDDSFLQVEENLSAQLADKELHLNNGNYYIGKNPIRPKIGDLRITFETVHVQPEPGKTITISVIAEQIGSRLVPYQSQTGEEIELFEYGVMSAEQMLRHKKIYQFFTDSRLRFLGFLMMFLGLYAIFSVSWVLDGAIPFLGKATELRGWLTSLITATILMLITIAIIWIDYSPITGRTLLVIALVLLYLLKFARKPPNAPTLIPEALVPQKSTAD